MLTWTRTSRGLTASHDERAEAVLLKLDGVWGGRIIHKIRITAGVLEQPGSWFGVGDELTMLRRRAEAILLQTSSRWYRVKLGGYCFSADGILYSCHWHQGSGRFHAGAGIESCPDDSFATLSEARAYCMKAIGGAA